MMVGKQYRDSMDTSRTLVPTNERGECRVYFDGVFAGKAQVPPSLFDLDPWKAERYGMLLDDGTLRDDADDQDDDGYDD